MALSVSGFQYSPTSLEQNNSDFLGSNSPTPSPTSYKSHPSDLLSSTTRQRPPHPSVESNETLYTTTYQHSPPPSALIPPSRPHKLAGELVAGRPRGQSASSRPTLRLHIANPTDPPPNDHNHVQEQAVRSTLQALNTKAQTMQSLYPSSVGYATINNIPGSMSPTRRRGETFSDFTSPPAGTNVISGSIPPIGPRSASPLPIRITTANLNYVPASAVNSTPNSSSSNPTSASSVNRSSTKRPYRASPLVGPQAMSTQGSATGTNSSVSTLPTSIFDDYPSSVSTPATQESASSEFSSHFTSSSRVPAGPRNRPLPVPPPITTSISTLSTTPSKVVSPLIGAAPLPHPLLPTQVLHERSSSGELNLNDPITAELAYRMEKRRGKQPMRGDTAPSSPTLGASEDMPYEFRSEKWKGKQRMRDSSFEAFTLASQQQLVSPTTNSVMNSVSLPHRSDTDSSRSSDDREVGLPPSLSGTLSNRPSRTSVASSHSSTRSMGVGAVNEGGVSKWKGKGKEVLKTNSISSISSLDRESGGSIARYTKERGMKKSGSLSSVTNTNPDSNPNRDSPLSTFSNSPVISPSISSSFVAPKPRHPPALMPGYHPSSISRIATGSPRISSPRLPGDLNSVARSASPRTTAWSPTPPMPMYVDPPMPLNVRRVVSPATSPVIAPKLPPKDYRYQPLQPPAGAAALVDESPPMHTHPFEADDSDEDSDEEGKRLFKEVEAAYVSPSASTLLASSQDDRLVDVGYGYAEPGYEDDERVYIDDGFDHGALDEIDDEFGFGVSASGQLVGGASHPPSASASTLGHGGNVIHTGISSSRVSLARETRRSPSPMRYARRRRNSLFEDEDDSTGPESNGMQSPPIRPGDLPPPSRSQVTQTSNSLAALEGFVYVENTTVPSPRPLADSSTAVHPIPLPNTNFLSPSSPLSPSSSSSSSPSPSDPHKPRGRQRKRNKADFDPAEILGEELEMAFSKNPSPTRYPAKNVYALGAPAVLMEDMVYVRGKWRMRSPSPGMSPTSPAGAAGGTNGLRSKAALAAGGGLRKYASEESLLSAGIGTLELDYRGGRTEIDHSGGAGPGFTPLRSSGFEEFNLTPNPHLALKRFADRAATPDSFDLRNLKLDPSLNQSRKSLSSKSASSGRQTPNLRGPGTKPTYADDYGFGSGWKAAVEVGREKSYKRPRVLQEKAQEHGNSTIERGRDNLSRAPTKLEKKRPVHRGLSLPRSSPGGGSNGSDLEIRRSGTTAASNHRHTQQQPPPEHISYELWIERGMDRKSAAVKGKKSLA